MRPPRPYRGTGASALLLVLAVVTLLSFLILGLAAMVNADQEEAGARAKEFRARQLAESGVAIGSHPLVRRGDPLLRQAFPDGEGFEVLLSSEGSRLQINALLAANQRSVLTRLFKRWGVSADDASAIVDCLLDWADDDDLTGLNGAERDYYDARGHPELPGNHPFRSVDEMALVRGMDVVAQKNPRWREAFTIWGDGLLDVNEASAELIEAVCGAPREQAEAVVRYRLGLDGLPGTDDDRRFTDLKVFRAMCGMSESDFKNVAAQLTLENAVQRIESTGIVAGDRSQIVVVARRGVNPPQYLAWFEP